MSFKFFVEYGWSAPPIAEQFAKFDGLETPPEEDVQRWQKIADALLMVSLHNIIPDSQVQRGRDKLARRIERWLVEHGYVVKAEDAQ